MIISTLQLQIFLFLPKIIQKVCHINFFSHHSLYMRAEVNNFSSLSHVHVFSLGAAVALLRGGVSFQTYIIFLVIIWCAVFSGSRQTSVSVAVFQKTLYLDILLSLQGQNLEDCTKLRQGMLVVLKSNV